MEHSPPFGTEVKNETDSTAAPHNMPLCCAEEQLHL